jgi:hypothetical protein
MSVTRLESDGRDPSSPRCSCVVNIGRGIIFGPSGAVCRGIGMAISSSGSLIFDVWCAMVSDDSASGSVEEPMSAAKERSNNAMLLL